MHIHVSARRWFQRSYGNTYHNARVYVDGESIGVTGIQYGYGDQFLQSAHALLKERGYGITYPFHRWASDTDNKFTYDVADVGREKDL